MPSPTSRPSRKARAHAPSYVESIDLSEEEEEKATHGDGNYDSGSSTASFRSSSPSSVEEVRPSAKKGGRGLGAAIVKAKAGAAIDESMHYVPPIEGIVEGAAALEGPDGGEAGGSSGPAGLLPGMDAPVESGFPMGLPIGPVEPVAVIGSGMPDFFQDMMG